MNMNLKIIGAAILALHVVRTGECANCAGALRGVWDPAVIGEARGVAVLGKAFPGAAAVLVALDGTGKVRTAISGQVDGNGRLVLNLPRSAWERTDVLSKCRLDVSCRGTLLQNVAASNATLGGAPLTSLLQYDLSRAARIECFLEREGVPGMWSVSDLPPNVQHSFRGRTECGIRLLDIHGNPVAPGRMRVTLIASADNVVDRVQVAINVSEDAGAGVSSLGGGANSVGGPAAAGSGQAANPNGPGSPTPAPASEHSDNGVRDHGRGEGRDGHGQGSGNGKGPLGK